MICLSDYRQTARGAIATRDVTECASRTCSRGDRQTCRGSDPVSDCSFVIRVAMPNYLPYRRATYLRIEVPCQPFEQSFPVVE
jgi:hypothetical protein